MRDVYSSICQLFELFLLSAFRAFADVPLSDLVGETPVGGGQTSASPAPQPDEVMLDEVKVTPPRW